MLVLRHMEKEARKKTMAVFEEKRRRCYYHCCFVDDSNNSNNSSNNSNSVAHDADGDCWCHVVEAALISYNKYQMGLRNLQQMDDLIGKRGEEKKGRRREKAKWQNKKDDDDESTTAYTICYKKKERESKGVMERGKSTFIQIQIAPFFSSFFHFLFGSSFSVWYHPFFVRRSSSPLLYLQALLSVPSSSLLYAQKIKMDFIVKRCH